LELVGKFKSCNIAKFKMSFRNNVYSDPNSLIPSSYVKAIQFFPTGTQENKDSGYVRLWNKEMFRGPIPVRGGAYDIRMGTTEMAYTCETCFNTKINCPGHPGFINLRYPCKNPFFRDDLWKWLKIICFECGYPIVKKKIYASKNQLLGEYVKISRMVQKCERCGATHPRVMKDKIRSLRFYMIKKEAGKTEGPEIQRTLYNHHISNIINRIPDQVVLDMGRKLITHPKKFIVWTVIAAPNTVRPDIRKVGGGRSNNDDITTLLKNIISINDSLPDEIPELVKLGTDDEKAAADSLGKKYYNLDQHYYDMVKGSSATGQQFKTVSSSNKAMVSIAQRFAKKEGIFRKNINGKRVLNSARSVITGDPQLPINVVGIPLYVATTIQIPEIVQPYNYDLCNTIYMNRRSRYPGWSRLVKAIDGKLYRATKLPETYKIQYGDIIYRDLIDGDIVGYGRQPSLEVSNISGFKVRVLPGADTFRMNVSSCSWFNADFDGDAMILVFPLSIISRNECANMSAAKNWVISYKDQTCSIGLFQDSLIGAAEFTRAGVYLNKWHAMQCFSHVNTTTERSVVFNKVKYSSRDLISMILPNINMSNRTPNIYKESYEAYIPYNPEDIKVEIDRGVLKHGILDKATVGQKKNNTIFHIISHEYGSEKAMETIYAMQQCIKMFQLYRGFTVGISDMKISNEAQKKIKENTAKIINEAREITEKLNQQKLYAPVGRTLMSFYEAMMMNALNPGDEFIHPILEDLDVRSNGMLQLVLTGSKGTPPNIISINAALGQQDVNGFRVPKTFGFQRTSPYFQRYDTEPKANGYVGESFKEGISHDVFQFVAQEARHGLISNALSTSVTGEANRHAIKNMESMAIGYFREMKKDNNLVQILYTDTGIDPRKLVSVKFNSVRLSDADFLKNYRADMKRVPTKYRNNTVAQLFEEEYSRLSADRQWYRDIFLRVEACDSSYLFTDAHKLPVNVYKIIEDVKYNYRESLGDKLNPITTIEKVTNVCDNLAYAYINSIQETQKMEIPEHFKAATILLSMLVRTYLCYSNLSKNKITDELLVIIIEQIRNTFDRSLIDYGMAMGIIAAQCISEPLTQYVLNSKHRSGIGGGTKTNTIVRVKEIWHAKSTIKMKNPTMSLRVLKSLENNKSAVQEIANRIEMLRFNKFITKMQIFYENFGEPVHPKYRHEKNLIESFHRRHKGLRKPSDLNKWCLRFELNKENMIFKSMTLESIATAIRKNFKEIYLVHTPENSKKIVIRCYFRSSLMKLPKSIKTGNDKIQYMNNYLENIRNMVISGIDGIISAEVTKYIISSVNDDGSIMTKKIFGIETNGSNMERILYVKGLDLLKSRTDSILEMSNLLGIEAGRESIINEMRSAMTGVSIIHCSIYADEMCSFGSVTSIQKTGLSVREYDNILLRASFSHPVQILEDAAKNAVLNRITGISSPLCCGSTPRIGTTYSDVVINEKFIRDHYKTLDEKLEEL